jgi:hypothetical protein
LAGYLARYTTEPIALTMGVGSLRDLFKEDYYSSLEGGILEAFGKLFTKNLRIYAYPFREPGGPDLEIVETIRMAGGLDSLYRHLLERGTIKSLDNHDDSLLHIFSRDVLRRIKESDVTWEKMVPAEIAAIIKERGFFGYQSARTSDESLVP